LEPLLIAQHPWESMMMDFITYLPKFDGYRMIMTVMDRFLKYASLMTAITSCTTKEAAKLLFRNVMMYWVLSTHILAIKTRML